MLVKKQSKKPFIFAAIGNGDLVGAFGNCQKDGYLQIIEKNVKTAFKSRGIDFELRVSVLGSFCGSSSTSNSNCLSSLIGNDVDLLQFSFPHSEDSSDMRLHLGSYAQGTVHIVESDCTSHAQSFTRGKNAKLLSKYAQFGSDVLCLDDALQTIMGEKYRGKSWNLIGDGLHKTARESNSGLVWRNWLPGPLGHQFLADCTSMLLFRALREMDSFPPDMSVSLKAPALRNPPNCFAVHNPMYGENQIVPIQTGNWRLLPGESAGDDEVPVQERKEPTCIHPDACGYYEARGSTAGSIVFNIPADNTIPNRRVYICCCCNAELCVEEQFRDYVKFEWKIPVKTLSLDEALNDRKRDDSLIAGRECLLIAKDMPSSNELSIFITAPNVNVPVRISKVIAG
jgi:hypothetical protein